MSFTDEGVLNKDISSGCKIVGKIDLEASFESDDMKILTDEVNMKDPTHDESDIKNRIVPFSGLIPSLKPSFSHINSEFIATPQSVGVYDEFGFRIDNSDGRSLLPFIESPVNRRTWLLCLEFSHTHTLGAVNFDEHDAISNPVGSPVDEEDDQFWPRVYICLKPSPRLCSLVRGQADDVRISVGKNEQLGIPHSLRSHIWPRLVGALKKSKEAKERVPSLTYTELVQLSSEDTLLAGTQIEKDLLRTMPNNICFNSPHSTGISRLRRVLRALAWLYVDVGYCQGMGMVTANLLLCLEEEIAFWMMCSIIEDVLPPSYFSSISLLGVQADQLVLTHLLPLCLPELDAAFKKYDIDLPLITLQWFLTLFSSVCPVALTFRIWDLIFYDGSVVLFRVALAMLTLKKDEILSLTNSAQIFNTLSNVPGSVGDVDALIQIACNLNEDYLEPVNILSLRRHYLAQLMINDAAILKDDPRSNLPKQHLTKREIKPPKSLMSTLLSSFVPGDGTTRPVTGMAVSFQYPIVTTKTNISNDLIPTYLNVSLPETSFESSDPRGRNIHRTEILIGLKQSIQLIVKHFRANDAQYVNAISYADYSMESHRKDLDTYVQVMQNRPKRAKALVDFARFEPDELEFHKNDIISVINSEDEHCWIGEFNNERGWFPARFVELLDERCKNYSAAGDDNVDEYIAVLVRGSLCHSLGAVFSHGLKRPRLLGESTCHPWHFIEEAAAKEVEKDFSSVYSRLVLCNTFRLDEKGKVLSPEEVLYRAIHSINMSHDLSGAHMDVKFRSLMCYGLNEQLLHLWFEILCSSVKVVEKWYCPWSYLRSPGWVQIKCELRLLNQFSFLLSPLYELNDSSKQSPLDSQHICSNFISPKCAPTKSRRFNKLITNTNTPSNRRTKNVKPLRLLTTPALVDPLIESPTLLALPKSKDDSFKATSIPINTGSAGDMLVKYHLFSWEL